MSALYVRTLFDQWAHEVASFVGVGFYATVNRRQDPDDSVWWTAEFQADTIEGETYCGPGYMEWGAIGVTVFAEAGLGDLDAVAALEDIVRALMAKSDPSQRLTFQNFEPVNEQSRGSADADYRVGVWINYRLNL